jgi:N-acetyl-alpha-D-muramate 1-phosphate uridylyltransferase
MLDKSKKNRIKRGMILAAGFGKRLQPLTLTTPKPLIDLGGKPLIQYALERYQSRQLETIVVNTHYLGDQVATYLRDKGEGIHVSFESEVLGTGGGIAKALPYFGNYPFFSLNSDIWVRETAGDILDQLEQTWDDDQMDALLVLVHRQNALDFQGAGDFFWNAATLTPTFRGEAPEAPYIYSGIQLLHPRLFEKLPPESGYFPLPDLYRKAQETHRLKAIILEGEWSDVGTLSALEAVRRLL